MNLITPTEREARLALKDFESGLVVLADRLSEVAQTENVIITLGNEGVFIHPKGQDAELPDDRLPAFNTNPKDTAGAGDSFLTCCSLAFVVNQDLWRSAYIGCIAAACQVSRLGNTPLTRTQIEKELQ